MSDDLRVSIIARRGIEQMKEGIYAEAQQQFEAALKLDRSNSWVYYNLGLLFLEQRNWQQALDNLEAVGDERIGVKIVARAIEEPMRWIAANAGHEGSIVLERVRAMKGAEGFNAQTERYEDLVAAGVIDPTKVVRSALQNAASIASLLLTTEAVISLIPERNQNAPAPMGGMEGGGMF